MKPNFTRWLIINSFVTALGIVAVITTFHIVTSLESRLAGIVVLLAFFISTQYAGRLSWRVDVFMEKEKRHRYERQNKELRHDLMHLEYAADSLPWIGLIGTMVGVLLLFLAGQHGGDPHQLADHVQTGIATVFVPSILGAVGSRVIDGIRHMLEHVLDEES